MTNNHGAQGEGDYCHYRKERTMEQQELFEKAIALGLRAAKVVLERGQGVAGIDRLIWETEHPPRLEADDQSERTGA